MTTSTDLDLRTPTADDAPRVILDSGEYPYRFDLDAAESMTWQRLAQVYEHFRSQAALGVLLDEDDAVALQESARQQTALVCPDIPQDELSNLPFMHMARINARYGQLINDNRSVMNE